MAVVEQALYTLLMADGTVTGLISTRAYPVAIPQGTTLPALSYQRISGPRVHSHDGPLGLAYPRYQFACKASTYLGAKGLANAVRQALDGYRGTVSVGGSPVRIDSILSQNEIDVYVEAPAESADAFLVWVDFIVWHGETE